MVPTMVDVWITAGNFDPRDIANPLFAAYDNDVYPSHIHILTPSNTKEQVETVIPVLETLASQEDLEIDITLHETSDSLSGFTDQVSYLFNDVDGSTVALDITGRPSVYATLLFQQAIAEDVDADHVYHLDYHHPPNTLDNGHYPSIPRTMFTLRDILADFPRQVTDD